MHVFHCGCWMALSCVLASPALAEGGVIQAPAIESTCLTYDGHYESAPLMEVKLPPGETRVNLQTQARACPASGACSEKQKAFLVEGDQVFVSQEKGGFRCAYYGTAGGNLIAGFLPTQSLVSAHEENGLTAAFLEGRWKDSGDEVKFSAGHGGKVHGEGAAVWQGSNPENVNEGAFDGEAQLSGSEAVFKDDDCEVHVRRRGNYLIVDDNRQCGGMNVAFSGIYVRAKAKVK